MWNRKFTANLVFNNLGNISDEGYRLYVEVTFTKMVQYNEIPKQLSYISACQENDWVVVFYNEAILYNDASIMLEEAKVQGYMMSWVWHIHATGLYRTGTCSITIPVKSS